MVGDSQCVHEVDDSPEDVGENAQAPHRALVHHRACAHPTGEERKTRLGKFGEERVRGGGCLLSVVRSLMTLLVFPACRRQKLLDIMTKYAHVCCVGGASRDLPTLSIDVVSARSVGVNARVVPLAT